MNASLVIVQDRQTQFDAPLYRRLAADPGLRLAVFYTATRETRSADVDVETGKVPVWDNVERSESRNLTEAGALGLSAQELRDRILELRPDHVIVCGYSPLPLFRLAWDLRRRGLSVGLRSDTTLAHSQFRGIRGLAKRLLLPFIVRRYSQWHPVGSLAREFLEAFGGRSRPVSLFPYAADNAWLAARSAPVYADREAQRARFGLRPEDRVVLGVLKFSEREDPLTLVDGFRLFRAKEPAARLLLVGDGPLRSHVEAHCEPMVQDVRLPGYVPYSQLPGFYALADLFVHPAVNEPWGVSVNEAMACGVPVVASDGVGAARDLISEGLTGRVYPRRDPAALAHVLADILAEPSALRAMGEAARVRVAEWSYERTRREFSQALSLACASRSLRPR